MTPTDKKKFHLTRDECKIVCMIMQHMAVNYKDTIDRSPPVYKDQFWDLYNKLYREFGSMWSPK